MSSAFKRLTLLSKSASTCNVCMKSRNYTICQQISRVSSNNTPRLGDNSVSKSNITFANHVDRAISVIGNRGISISRSPQVPASKKEV